MMTKQNHFSEAGGLLDVEPRPDRKGIDILFAINEREKELFYPKLGTAALPGVRFLCLDPAKAKDWPAVLARCNPQILVTCWSTPTLPENLVESGLTRLRYICHTTGTVRRVIPRALIEDGLLVSNWGRSITNTVAEHALLLILASLRKMPQWEDVICGGKDWLPWGLKTQSLYGRRVGLHGFGAVGQYLAGLLKPFGGTVQAYSDGLSKEFYKNSDVRPCDSIEELFSTSEILVECEALNSKTCGQVNRDLLRLLPPGALFVNVGRGAVVNEVDLMEEARTGRIRIALDVYTQEPLPSTSPLLELDAVLSPHIAGPTMDRFPVCGDWALHNIQRYLEGRPVESPVTLEVYDRST